MLGCLTMRMICNSRFCFHSALEHGNSRPIAYLEALILKDSLNCCVFSVRGELCLEDNTERAISYNLALCVLHFFGFTSDAILHFLTYDFFDGRQLWHGDKRNGGRFTSHAQAREPSRAILRRHVPRAKTMLFLAIESMEDSSSGIDDETA